MQDGDSLKSLLWFTEALRVDAGHPDREETHRLRIASVLEQSPRLVQIITHEGQPIANASFNSIDDRLATVGSDAADRTVRVWDLPSGQLRAKSTRLAKIPLTVTFSPDGTRLLVTMTDATVLLLDAANALPIGSPLPHQLRSGANGALYPAFDPTGRLIVTQPKTNVLQLLSARSGEPIGKPLVHTNDIVDFQFGDGSSKLFTRTEPPANFVWDTKTGECLPYLAEESEVTARVFAAPQSDLMLLDGRVRKLGSGTPNVTASSDMPARDGSGVQPNKMGAARELNPRPLGEDWIDQAAFSPEGGRVLTASRRRARVWDVVTGEPLTSLLAHLQTVSRVAFSPDGHRVLTVSNDNLTRVWDADSGEPLTPPIPHATGAGPSQFSGSGRYLVTIHPRYVACVWDLHREATPPALLQPPGNGGMNESRGILLSQGAENLIRVSNSQGRDLPLHPISLKTIPVQFWPDQSSRFVLLEGEFSKVQVWESVSDKENSFSAMPLTPPIPSHYALDVASAKKVDLPTTDWPVQDLIELAQILSGSKLDEKHQGWKLLEPEELYLNWEDLHAQLAQGMRSLGTRAGSGTSPSGRRLKDTVLGPSAVSLSRWHRAEAAAAEGASDWWAAAFHWARLGTMEPGNTEAIQRLAYSSNCAVAAQASAHGYREWRRVLPPRDPRATPQQVNLTASYTGPLSDWVSDARRDVGLQAGLQTLGGVTYDLRGFIRLYGLDHALRQVRCPERVPGVQIHQHAKQLHLLHTEQWANSETNEVIARLTFRYANGQQEPLPIQHGIHLAADYSGDSQVKLGQLVSITTLPNGDPPTVRLYKYSWPNPHPEWEISELDLVSTKTRASYVLLAITVE